jgi:response regulator RpfG family c-di-GMP phosphodiesterase
MLAGLLGRDAASGLELSNQPPPWKQRKALLCLPEEHQERIARPLAEDGYQVFMARDTKQAVERMRENQLDVVLLDPQFDGAEQGAAFVVREVNVLRPAQRRRLFFVLLSPTLRTMDAHGAFLNNVNAIVNLKDVDDLVDIVGHAVRDYNELYKEFNIALKTPAI